VKADIAPRARREILDASLWIARDSPRASEGFLVAVAEAAERIGRHPEIGAERTTLASPRFRVVMLTRYPYAIVYDCLRRPPRIVRVVHGSRDLSRVLRSL
jgi:toxin ParE1/3/4